jgi:ribonuclease R
MNNNQGKNPTQNKEERFLNRLKQEILAFYDINYDSNISLNQLNQAFSVKDKNTKAIFEKIVLQLLEEEKLSKQPDGSFKINNGLTEREGRVEHSSQNRAFVITDGQENDVVIETEDLNGAIDGDLVKISIWKGRKKLEGQVIEVIERKRTELVGNIDIRLRYAIVKPDARRIYQNIIVAIDDIKEAKNGDKVLVKITQYPQNGGDLHGQVTEVLGKAGDHNTEMHAILAEFGLPIRFDEAVEKEAEAIAEHIPETEIQKRRDFRNILTFTIDPADAKDFDDALSIKYLENGNIEIGVHIADVTHYVKPGTILEKEAFHRATSVYLVDRVVPMLPEKLSNQLCSLRPHEDKLTFSAVFELDANAEIKSQWFGRTVIHSDHRFSYEDAQAVLDLPATETDSQPIYQKELLLMNALAKKLRDERFAKGAVNFETVEVKFKLDTDGKPLGIYQKIRKDSHKLIEEFMLLANKKVAEYVYNMVKGENKNTMIYRIHESPNLDKLQNFSQFIKRFGYSLKVSEDNLKQVSDSLNGLMKQIEGKPEQRLLESLAIRTMAKARYSTAQIGHFGLAFQHYTHFTSPIRRYPDMMAHRLLQHYLDKGTSVDKASTEAQGKYASEREKMAAEAERASIKYKQVEYMSGLDTNQVFMGVVSGVTEFGFFVEITETASEGMIRLSDLKDDHYELDSANYRIVGQRTGRTFTFGDALEVSVKSTDLAKRSIDLELAGRNKITTTSRSYSKKDTNFGRPARTPRPARPSRPSRKPRR